MTRLRRSWCEREGRYRSYHFDVRGSTVALSDEKGEVVERFGYGPYGELVSGDATQTPFLFNGQYGVMSDENGLYYMRARFYSPLMKRFVNRDVVAGEVVWGQSLNRFAFVEGNPVGWVDPWGLAKASPLFPGPESFPDTPNLEVCKYYDRIAKEQGCNYHSYAAQICRGDPNPWSVAANFLLTVCSAVSQYPVEKIKNCVRTCLVASDHYVRENYPECKINCSKGKCTRLDCIDSYHHYCFKQCGVSWRCYGGNFDGWIPPKVFYDDCPLEDLQRESCQQTLWLI